MVRQSQKGRDRPSLFEDVAAAATGRRRQPARVWNSTTTAAPKGGARSQTSANLPPVRQMEQGGNADQVQFVSVQSWGYDKGGYQVELVYRVTNPTLTSEFVATVVGMENVDESGAREWYVRNIRLNGQPVLTDEGLRMQQLSEDGRSFAERWLKDIKDWEWGKAYLSTLPPAMRKEQSNMQHGTKYLAGLKAFRDGAIVRADPGKFWASSKQKIIDAVHGLFGKNEDATITLRPAPPIYRRDGDHVSLRYDTVIVLPPEYGVQAQLVVTANARNGDPAPNDLAHRVVGFVQRQELDAWRSRSGRESGSDAAASPLISSGRFRSVEKMAELLFFRPQITAVVLIGRDLNRYTFDDLQAIAVHADHLLWIVRQ